MFFFRKAVVTLVVVFGTVFAKAEVHQLGDANFDDFVESLPQDTLLLVDFYKAGCSHCQRLIPVLDYLDQLWEKEEPNPSKRWFKLAKVDCTRNPRLKEVFGLTRLPELRFVRGGEWSTYDSGRTLEDIVAFKERMSIVPLRVVDTEGLLQLVSAEEPLFVLAAEAADDPALVAPGVPLTATMMQHVATFCTAPREVLSSFGLGREAFPALVKVVAGPAGGGGVLQPASYEGDLAAASTWALQRWVEQESYGLVTEYSSDNFTRLGGLGKLMVIGIVDPKAEGTPAFNQALATVAAGLGLKHSDKLIFGTLNGVEMAGFAETFNVYGGLPRLVVLDVDKDVFYSVEFMSLEVAEMEAFLVDVLSGDVLGQPSSVRSARYVNKIWWVIQQGGAWSFLLVIPVLFLLWVFCDSPEQEDRRARQRAAKWLEKKEARRQKSD